MEKIRILVADDHTVVRMGLSALLDVSRILESAAWDDPVLAANAARDAAARLGAAVGAEYSEDLLENLFSRFCVGK